MAVLVDALVRDEVQVPGVVAPAPIAKSFAHAWGARTGREMERASRQGVYSISRVNQLPAVEGADGCVVSGANKDY